MNEAIKNTIKTPIIWGCCMIILAIAQWAGDFYLGNEIIDHAPLYCGIIWILFASFTGCFEAYYYNYASKDNSPDKPNLHFMLTLIRAIVMVPIFVLTDWKSVLCYMAIFPFFHDGSYYTQRERITPGVYPKKWFAQSTTSTAWSDKFMTSVIRIILAIIGTSMLVITCYKYI